MQDPTCNRYLASVGTSYFKPPACMQAAASVVGFTVDTMCCAYCTVCRVSWHKSKPLYNCCIYK